MLEYVVRHEKFLHPDKGKPRELLHQQLQALGEVLQLLVELLEHHHLEEGEHHAGGERQLGLARPREERRRLLVRRQRRDELLPAQPVIGEEPEQLV
jgi:hypothetical protein